MHMQRWTRPSPALIVGMVALFVALGGTAGAVVTAAVPLAKRALLADKAKVATTAKTADKAKTATNALALNGLTAPQIATAGAQAALTASPPGARPSSTAWSLVTVKKTQVSFTPGEEKGVTISCDAGRRALGGGFSSTQFIFALDSFPTNDPPTSWSLYLVNGTDPPVAATADIYVTCLG